jgi:polar amino acid transport system substrate-binding protein
MPAGALLRRTAVLGIGLVATALVAAGCSSKSTSTGTSTAAGPDAAVAGKLVKPGKLTVCTTLDYKPFEYKGPDGKVIGLDIDLIDLVAKRLGVTTEVIDIDFAAIQTGTAYAAKSCDLGAAGMTITDKRKQAISFSSPYFDATQALLVKKGSGITSLEGLAGKKIGAQSDTTGLEYLQKNAKSAKIIQYDGLPTETQALKTNQVDAIINDNGVLYDFAKANPDTEVSVEFNTGEQYGIGAAKTGSEALVKVVDEVLAKAKSDGTYVEIYKKWLGTAPKSS